MGHGCARAFAAGAVDSPLARPEVLDWLAPGKSNRAIATILGAGVRTVHKPVEHIFQKLGLETRTGATLVTLEVLRTVRR